MTLPKKLAARYPNVWASLSFRLRPDAYEALETWATELHTSKAELVRDIVDEALKQRAETADKEA